MVYKIVSVVPYACILVGSSDEVVVRMAHVDEPVADSLVCDCPESRDFIDIVWKIPI